MYYKVVRNENGRLMSASTGTWCDKELRKILEVEYKLDEFVYPKFEDSKLFVFSDLNSAKQLRKSWYNHKLLEIYECEIVGLTEGEYYLRFFYELEDLVIGDEVVYQPCPYPNTVFVDGVKLLKKVEDV